MRLSAFESSNACASVLATMHSNPNGPASTKLLTVLPPAPPIPITFIVAPVANKAKPENETPMAMASHDDDLDDDDEELEIAFEPEDEPEEEVEETEEETLIEEQPEQEQKQDMAPDVDVNDLDVPAYLRKQGRQ